MGRKRSRLVLPKDEYKNLRHKVRCRDGWRCRCCQHRDNLHVHHIIYRSQGGDDAEWNLITLCAMCHDAVDYSRCIIKQEGSEIVDAGKPVQFVCVDGWIPGKPYKKRDNKNGTRSISDRAPKVRRRLPELRSGHSICYDRDPTL